MSAGTSRLFAKAIKDFEAARFADAERAAKKILGESPGRSEVAYFAGVVACRLEKFEEAVAYFHAALPAHRNVAALHGELSSALLALDRPAEATGAAQRALALDPRLTKVRGNLARALFMRGRVSEAIDNFKVALSSDATDIDLLNDLGNVLYGLKRRQEAADLYARSIALDPGNIVALEGLLFSRLDECNWQDFERLSAGVLGTSGRKTVSSCHRSLFLSGSPAFHLAVARSASRRLNKTPPRFNHKRTREPGKLRVGYLSGNFAEHPLAYSVVEVFEQHDRETVETFGYSIAVGDNSDMRRRIEAAFTTFRDCAALSNAAVAERVYGDRIDVLVDLQGYTQGAHPHILAYRPAPIQVSWLGFPGSTGANFIDYILGDDFATPASAQQHFSERIVRLPGCYFPTDRTRAVEETPARASVGLPDDGFVFCSFNNAPKLSPHTFDRWMRVLAAVPDSVLWNLGDDVTTSNLRREAEERGVAGTRIVQAQRMPSVQHLARLRLADLMLDTLPCNAHTTAADALWMGLPVLTVPGEAFSGRVAGSMLTAVGLPKLIANSADEYERMAIRFGTHPQLLSGYREHLERNRHSFPLFDTQALTRHVEAAFLEMSHRV